MLKPLVNMYWEVCLLRRSPADTPYSPFLLGLFTFLYYILMQFQWYFQKLPVNLTIKSPLSTGLLLLLSNLIYIALLLKVMKKSNRFVQTSTSLMAVHSIMHLMLLPFILVMSQFIVFPGANEIAAETGLLTLIGMILIGGLSLAITIWQLVIIIYLFRKAMDGDQLSAVLATLGLFIFSNLFASLIGSLF